MPQRIDPPPMVDTREAQARRAADFMETQPEGATGAEIGAASEAGCWTRVISAMRRELGYGVAYGPWRWVTVAGSTARRKVRTYVLLYRPSEDAQLPLALE